MLPVFPIRHNIIVFYLSFAQITSKGCTTNIQFYVIAKLFYPFGFATFPYQGKELQRNYVQKRLFGYSPLERGDADRQWGKKTMQ